MLQQEPNCQGQLYIELQGCNVQVQSMLFDFAGSTAVATR